MKAADDPELAPDPAGELPCVASELETQLARAVTWCATLLMACVVVWEIGAPIVNGHYASTASMGIIADNMRSWGIAAPVWIYTADPPDPALYYCHHPWGIFWTTTLVQSIFGRSDLTCRLAPAFLSVMTVPLVSAIGRLLHRPLSGAVAAALFVSLPISLSFAQFNALEVPVMAWSCLFLWGWIRTRRHGRRRHLVVMLAGATLAMHADWPGFVLVGLVLATDLGAFFLGGRRPSSRFVTGWALLASVAVLSAAFYGAMFVRYGAMDDLLASYELRRGAEDVSLRDLFDGRRLWDEWMLTRATFVVIPLGVVAAAWRAVRERSALELAPLLVVAMAAFQYIVFRQGAWIHVFWPHYFALGAALCASALIAEVAPRVARAVGRTRGLAGRGHVLVLAVSLSGLGFVLRDGLELLVWARRTGGRFDERGAGIETDAAEIALLRTLASEIPPEARVGLHESLGPTWAHTWALGGRIVDHGAALPRDGNEDDSIVVADLRRLKPAAVQRLLECCKVRVVDAYAVVEPGPHALLSETFVVREPATRERLLGAAFEPVRSIRPSPYPAWLVADHFGGHVPSIDRAPETTEELAVAFDAAFEAGDPVLADEHRRTLSARLGGNAITFDDDTRLLGVEVVPGVSPRATLVFAAAGPLPERVVPSLRARLVEAPGWSLARQPLGATRDLGLRMVVPPSRWKPGYLYAATVDLLPRPGQEVLELAFVGKSGAPKPVGPAGPMSRGAWVELVQP